MKTLAEIVALTEGVERTALLAEWVQLLFDEESRPVLVGGAAVELFTAGAYTTGDLDLVGTVPAGVAKALAREGFVKRGRHWINERAQVFLEFPSSTLAEGERAVRLRIFDCEVLAVGPEDLLAERLAAWKHWRSTVDGVNAWLLYRAQRPNLNRRRLAARCRAHDAADALAALRAFAGKWAKQRPSATMIETWAREGP